MMVPFVVVLVHRFACAPLVGVPSRRRPPRRAARRRCYPRPRADALGRFAGSFSSSRCNPRAELCPLARIRVSSPKPRSAPPLAGTTAAARAPPSSPQRSQPLDPDPTVQIRSDRSQYRSNRAAATFLLKSPSVISVLQAGPSAVQNFLQFSHFSFGLAPRFSGF